MILQDESRPHVARSESDEYSVFLSEHDSYLARLWTKHWATYGADSVDIPCLIYKVTMLVVLVAMHMGTKKLYFLVMDSGVPEVSLGTPTSGRGGKCSGYFIQDSCCNRHPRWVTKVMGNVSISKISESDTVHLR